MDDDVPQKILADLHSAGHTLKQEDLRSIMSEMMFQAAEALETRAR
ncbi:DUF1476 domain-containing protein [Rhizobium bangladeshense]|nr:DUF1476 domain-containing protein [Rhizobium bangladeshense]MBX4893237.1 hypothetical protein [Rhizobium bangladeshense]MBX4898827.1 hypothetical protein [Rhizobium bangladeshense]MBY3616875.1 hypothetical protein [Rhizobium bangladeshense]